MRQIFQSLPWIHPTEPLQLQSLYRRHGIKRKVKKGEILKSGGETPKLFFLEKGLCAYLIEKEIKDRPSVLALILPQRTMGDITCLSQDRVNVVSIALQDSSVLEVSPTAFFSEASKNPKLMQVIAQHIVHKQESHLEGMVANFTLSPPMRLKVFLKTLLVAHDLPIRDGWNIIPLLLTNEQIGSVVNLTRVSVSRIFSVWQSNGLIQKQGRTLRVRPELFDDVYDWMSSDLSLRPH